MGQVTDPRPLLVGDAAGDEALDRAIGVDDSDRRVLGAGQDAHLVGDQLEDAIDIEDPADAAHRLIERRDLRGRSFGNRPRARRGQAELERPRQRGHLLRLATDPCRADRFLLARSA